MAEAQHWNWWLCPDCGSNFGTTATIPDRVWCSCGTADEPEPTDPPEIDGDPS